MARMKIITRRAPQEARMAISVLLSVGFFKEKTHTQKNDFFPIIIPVSILCLSATIMRQSCLDPESHCPLLVTGHVT